jgi:5-oxopent-3-ene-1,2,5-tricarboxylate decarboxylase/2-hydroxyhepta-2,4-diene-1,7-dioate isomerase
MLANSAATSEAEATAGASARLATGATLPSLTQADGQPAPVRLSGVIYGVLMNDPAALAQLGDAVHAPPYKAPPRAPVLYVKPRNTHSPSGAAVTVDPDVPAFEIGAAIGVVIGRTACRVAAASASDYIAGYLLAVDLTVPHAAFYRPSIRFKARDGSCLVGATLADPDALDPDAVTLAVAVDGEIVHRPSTAGRTRPVAQLLADVSEFMTLRPGDLLLTGIAAGAPQAGAGQSFSVEAPGLGRIEGRLVAEHLPSATESGVAGPVSSRTGALAGPVARVAHGGAIHDAVPDARGLRLADGRVIAEDQAVWLPPFDVGTVIALGLNYADHVKELSKELTVTTRDEPLVFVKGPGTLIGHRGFTRRPDDVTFMHYECELAVVIGKPARRVSRSAALGYVAGYAVCNDYAFRDYLENWYRPNLRVKNRDGATAIGPWLVPAAAVPDPQALALRTTVNGRVTQQGTTADMINDVASLLEYLSDFMTLLPGDVILTGTPDGVVDVRPGDVVVTAIEGIGSLMNTIVGDDLFGR